MNEVGICGLPFQGEKGERGSKGERGEVGLPGEAIFGIQGPIGPRGDPGKYLDRLSDEFRQLTSSFYLFLKKEALHSIIYSLNLKIHENFVKSLSSRLNANLIIFIFVLF